MCSASENSYINRGELRDAVEELFKSDSEIAVFYFSGHGSIDSLGGYLCTSEINRPDDGLSLNDIMGFVATSKAHNKVIDMKCQDRYIIQQKQGEHTHGSEHIFKTLYAHMYYRRAWL